MVGVKSGTRVLDLRLWTLDFRLRAVVSHAGPEDAVAQASSSPAGSGHDHPTGRGKRKHPRPGPLQTRTRVQITRSEAPNWRLAMVVRSSVSSPPGRSSWAQNRTPGVP